MNSSTWMFIKDREKIRISPNIVQDLHIISHNPFGYAKENWIYFVRHLLLVMIWLDSVCSRACLVFLAAPFQNVMLTFGKFPRSPSPWLLQLEMKGWILSLPALLQKSGNTHLGKVPISHHTGACNFDGGPTANQSRDMGIWCRSFNPNTCFLLQWSCICRVDSAWSLCC